MKARMHESENAIMREWEKEVEEEGKRRFMEIDCWGNPAWLSVIGNPAWLSVIGNPAWLSGNPVGVGLL
jgi:hypothetical protein